MSTKHQNTAKSEVKLPDNHGLVSLTVRRSQKFMQPSSNNSVKRSNQGLVRSTVDTSRSVRRSYGCKSVSCVIPGEFNQMDLQLFRKIGANETGFNKEFTNGMCMEKELATQQSEQLLNAVGIFNSNKELFMNLLENPNSLLGNQIEDFQHTRTRKKKTKHSHEGKLVEFHAKEKKASNFKHSHDILSSVEEDDHHRLPKNLVVFKPSPLTRQDSVQRLSLCSFLHYHSFFVRNRPRSRPTYFSVKDIKRKIMDALKLGGKERKKSANFFKYAEDYGKEIAMEALRRTSSGRSYLASTTKSAEMEKLALANDEQVFDEDELSPKGSESIHDTKMSVPTSSSALDNLSEIDRSERIDVSRENENLDSNELDSRVPAQSPTSSVDELPHVQSLQVDTEEQPSSPERQTMKLHGYIPTPGLDQYGTISECIKTLLLSSRFQCEELVVRFHLLDQLNVLTLIDELKFLHNQVCGDCIFLVDYISEILEELDLFYKGNNPGSLDVKRIMFYEVMKRWNRQLRPQPIPRTWENLAKEDMIMRSGTWKDSRAGVEDIVVETTQHVLEDLIMESTIDCLIGMHRKEDEQQENS